MINSLVSGAICQEMRPVLRNCHDESPRAHWYSEHDDSSGRLVLQPFLVSECVAVSNLWWNVFSSGYYAFGASTGREWYVNPALQFKDDTVSEDDLNLLNIAFEKVGPWLWTTMSNQKTVNNFHFLRSYLLYKKFQVEDLLAQPRFRNFTWIGSGLQKHYGHITIARQDKDKSAPARLSNLLWVKKEEKYDFNIWPLHGMYAIRIFVTRR